MRAIKKHPLLSLLIDLGFWRAKNFQITFKCKGSLQLCLAEYVDKAWDQVISWANSFFFVTKWKLKIGLNQFLKAADLRTFLCWWAVPLNTSNPIYRKLPCMLFKYNLPVWYPKRFRSNPLQTRNFVWILLVLTRILPEPHRIKLPHDVLEDHVKNLLLILRWWLFQQWILNLLA